MEVLSQQTVKLPNFQLLKRINLLIANQSKLIRFQITFSFFIQKTFGFTIQIHKQQQQQLSQQINFHNNNFHNKLISVSTSPSTPPLPKNINGDPNPFRPNITFVNPAAKQTVNRLV